MGDAGFSDCRYQELHERMTAVGGGPKAFSASEMHELSEGIDEVLAQRDTALARVAELEAERDSLRAQLAAAEQQTAERIAAWLTDDRRVARRLIAADIRQGKWRTP